MLISALGSLHRVDVGSVIAIWVLRANDRDGRPVHPQSRNVIGTFTSLKIVFSCYEK
jgi:hypothetical protein